MQIALPQKRNFALRITALLLLGWVAIASHTGTAAEPRTKNLVLVTLDGVRIEEMFGGVDIEILKASARNRPVEDTELYKQFWAPTPEERREKIMPFFWKTLMRDHGSIAGNPNKGSIAKLTNRHRFSYPGYSEILIGRAHDDVIDSNSKRQNPFPTSLEFLKTKLGLTKEQVAVFASWDVFDFIAEHTPGSLTINCGFTPYDNAADEIKKLNQLQQETSTPWDSVRHDAYTFRFAMAHVRAHTPRVLYLALGETDDWAHDERYDRVIKALQLTDDYLQQLWNYLQTHPEYRDQTTILVATDHGRGITPATWPHHGSKVEGAENVWLAVISPDCSLRGEWKSAGTIYQNQIAATLCRFVGLDYSEHEPAAGRPIEYIFGGSK